MLIRNIHQLKGRQVQQLADKEEIRRIQDEIHDMNKKKGLGHQYKPVLNITNVKDHTDANRF